MACVNAGKAVPLQAWTGPEGSRKLRFPDFMTTAHVMCVCQMHLETIRKHSRTDYRTDRGGQAYITSLQEEEN